MTQDQYLPTTLVRCDIEAERRVVGALILDRDLISDAMLILVPESFYSIQNKYIFESICSLYIDGNPTTPETIANDLSKRKDMDKTRLEWVGGAGYIMGIIDSCNPDEFSYWVDVVITRYDERKLLEFAESAMNMVYSNSGTDISKIRNRLEEKLISLSGEVSNSSSPIGASIPDLDARIQKYIDNPDGITGMSTGLRKLDQSLDGLQPGNVTIIYAPSSRFKSLFATNIGWHLAEQNVPGLWFTTEMPRVQVLERLLQIEAGLNLKWLRRDKKLLQYRKLIRESQDRLHKYPIYFCDTSALDVSEIRSEISRQKRWHDIKYIIVDLVDHVSSSKYKDEMVNNQRAVMASMKQIAKDFDIHVLLVSHVTKGTAETRAKADLDVEEMIGSSAKYQDVDASISIGPAKMDEKGRWVAMSREDILWAMSNGGFIDVLLSVTKNRHGELLRYIVTLDFTHGGRFSESLFKPIETTEQLTLEE